MARHSLVVLMLTSAVLLAATAWAAADTQPEDVREWRFRVLLDGNEIGFHRYELEQYDDHRIVQSRAEFDVKFLFFNAYTYRHSLSARWNGQCLESIEADTNANGKKLSVSGTRESDQFVVRADGEKEALPPCVMDFSYWDPRILEQSKLLNPQTGEYLDVDVQKVGDQEEVAVGGETVMAQRYRIIAKEMRIDIWYAGEERRWVALESLAKGDRVIRYERA